MATTSLDGFIEDATGNFDWGAPDEEVHSFINDLQRATGTYLCGRRVYETMSVWETDPGFYEGDDILRDFAQIWQAADKVVYSRTLTETVTPHWRIEREFDPEAVRRMKEEAERDLNIGGAELAGEAFRAGVVDECHIFVVPHVVGTGKPAFPGDVRLEMELLEERRFANGTVYLRYGVATSGRSAG